MTAHATAIVVVGDEILAGHTLDTNTQHLAKAAYAAGYPVRWTQTVGDDVTQIGRIVARAAADLSLTRIAVCGGVGPTPDDRTLEGVAFGLNRDLEENATAYQLIAARTKRLFEAGWLKSPDVSYANRTMATIPRGATVLENPDGMAPLIVAELAGSDRWLFVLPGVPREFISLVDTILVPRYFAGGQAPVVVEQHYSGIPEADIAAPMQRVMDEFPDVTIGSYPQSQRRELLVRLKGTDEDAVKTASSRFEELVSALQKEKSP